MAFYPKRTSCEEAQGSLRILRFHPLPMEAGPKSSNCTHTEQFSGRQLENYKHSSSISRTGGQKLAPYLWQPAVTFVQALIHHPQGKMELAGTHHFAVYQAVLCNLI